MDEVQDPSTDQDLEAENSEHDPATEQDLESGNSEIDPTEGLDDIGLSDVGGNVGAESQGVEDVLGEGVEDVVVGCKFDDRTAVNGIDGIVEIDFRIITAKELMVFHFPNNEVAFMFYNSYASMNGFAARKSKVMRNCRGETIQQTFLCHKEGMRHAKHTNNTQRVRRPKPVTRCGCKARCMVHVEGTNGRWYIKMFDDVHNHTLMEKNLSTMLPAHRRMSETEKSQMMSMRKVGITTSHIFGLFATEAGGYDKVGYIKRDLYNEQAKQKRTQFTDAQAALDFLEGMRKKDEMMFWRHTKDVNGRLEHLFWCDGTGRRDFTVFGDVLAFDATYKKNTYQCPFVVFSGINHHNQSIVFATAIVVSETEETYVWLLEQFLTAMEGKSPVSIITDGDMAMRNAIKKVFPLAHHRLCAWHLLRNATSNIKNPKFVPKFKQCMFGDYDIGEFRCKWDKLVEDFGLQENNWLLDMYDKRHMWAAAHIRGHFFGGFRTTSRCESLHAEFGKYVNCHDNLLEFLEHYFRWLSYLRYREVEADFLTAHGDLVIETQLRCLEKSAADVYTREVFMLFRPVLQRALTYKVVGIRQTASCFIYTVCRYCREDREWRVMFSQSSLDFKCSCQRLESVGIPCEHLVRVMVHLDIVNLPECVVLKRWTKSAKDSLTSSNQNERSDSQPRPGLIYQYKGLVERGLRLAKAAAKCGKEEYMRKTIEMVTQQTELLESLCTNDAPAPETETDHLFEGPIRNPIRVRHKGCGASTSAQNTSIQKTRTCGVCGYAGHNRKSCHLQRQLDFIAQYEDDESEFGNTDDTNVR